MTCHFVKIPTIVDVLNISCLLGIGICTLPFHPRLKAIMRSGDATYKLNEDKREFSYHKFVKTGPWYIMPLFGYGKVKDIYARAAGTFMLIRISGYCMSAIVILVQVGLTGFVFKCGSAFFRLGELARTFLAMDLERFPIK